VVHFLETAAALAAAWCSFLITKVLSLQRGALFEKERCSQGKRRDAEEKQELKNFIIKTRSEL
jgi:hypothetical protein